MSSAELYLERARRFAQEVVAPVAAELDRRPDPVDCFSWEVVEQGSRLGLRTLTLAPEHGGAGLDLPQLARVVFELAKVDVGIAALFAQTNMLWRVIAGAATEEQRGRWLPRFRDDPRCLLALAVTEPEVGSDHVIPWSGPDPPRLATRATPEGGGWCLEGRKLFVDNGNRAGIYLVMAQTDPDTGLDRGTTCFVIEAGTPGLRPGRVFDKAGERLANHSEVLLEGCRVSEGAVLGAVNRGFEVLERHFRGRATLAGCCALGVAEAAYARTLAWCRERVQGGRPLIEHDLVGVELAEMRMQLTAAWDHLLATAARIAAGSAGLAEDGLAKVHAAQVGYQVVTRALDLHGGRGYLRDAGVEKWWRDVAAFFHSDGANRALLIRAARAIRARS
ncbi:MAG TPA: acyl-CoA dehydrogenase family protein [Candidatus Dormibacteraeota bacterium]|nr:acyl-CoA dehydrogenase family protein [Candidatus Dormibacteraeota bacterium]